MKGESVQEFTLHQRFRLAGGGWQAGMAHYVNVWDSEVTEGMFFLAYVVPVWATMRKENA